MNLGADKAHSGPLTFDDTSRSGVAREGVHPRRTTLVGIEPRVQGPPETQTRFHSPQPLVSKATSEPLMVTIWLPPPKLLAMMESKEPSVPDSLAQ